MVFMTILLVKNTIKCIILAITENPAITNSCAKSNCYLFLAGSARKLLGLKSGLCVRNQPINTVREA